MRSYCSIASLIFFSTSARPSACACRNVTKIATNATRLRALMPEVITRILAFRNHELDAPVLVPAFFRAIVRNWNVFAVTLGIQAVAGDALLDQVVADALGALLAELQVEVVVADRVGVALDLDLDLRIVLQ